MNPHHQLLEQVLILRCQIGDNDALAELVGRYSRPLRYFIGHMTDSRDAAEDLFQDCWVRVIEKISTLRNPATFPAWLYRIARNLMYQHFRKRKPSVNLNETIAVPDETQEGDFSPDDVAQIHRGLKELPPEHREVLLLRFLEQMSYQQIADVLGCNLNTVKSRVFYAKQRLKRIMEGSHGQGK